MGENGEQPGGTWRHRLEGLRVRLEPWSWARFPLALFALSRLAILGTSEISMRLVPRLYHFEGRRQRFLQDFPSVDGLCRWDCGWYEKLTVHGYQAHVDAAFWPLYPALSRLLTEITGLPHHFSMLFWSNAFALGAFVVIYRLFEQIEGDAAARAGLTLFAAYPFAFFNATGYPESMFLFFTALAILAARKGSFFGSGAALGFGLLARLVSVAAGGAVLWRFIETRVDGKRQVLSWRAVGLLLPGLFLLGWMIYLAVALDDPFAFWTARSKGWGDKAWWSIFIIFEHTETALISLLVFSLIPAVGVIALTTRAQWRHLAAFAVPLLLLYYSTGMGSMGRYSASVWPAFLPLGVWLSKRPWLLAPVVMTLAVFQGLYAFLFMHQFRIL